MSRNSTSAIYKAEHDSESPMSIYEFTHENTHKYHMHESQVPMSMGFQGSKYLFWDMPWVFVQVPVANI